MDSTMTNYMGQENLPPALKLINDKSYQYSTHKHNIETSNDGTLHSYTIVLSREPLESPTSYNKYQKNVEPVQKENQKPKDLNKMTAGPHIAVKNSSGLVSQISSTTSSERKRRTLARPSSSSESDLKVGNIQQSNQYFTLPSVMKPSALSTEDPKKVIVQSNTSSSSMSDASSKKSLPTYTYLSGHTTGSARYVTMVNVKFLLLHCDVLQRRAQSMFTDEFPSDCRLEEVVINFHQLCCRQLLDQNFNPRLSYCIGELNYSDSKPVSANDMSKTLAQLATTQSIAQLSIIVDVTEKNMKLK
ncbi:uncharacterized protein CELE_C38C10.3 [Caenorhabditis elegans]|uniref:Uncharacterized protein C38C10.3 n=1 Tax=Caenorhabditis elegans TaxID=6239 RepID=YLD3_CAEEL|nr:Uncharacterized protein CELE_C38C10.3 [Caenorhabditis elegans]Q03568.1 RecName: Full=Uncharacterized protein C38C10.3 [Caenorhabditis elegans]CAA79547.1 Uncharacterized protein CELE_C38C10.3 [Caenorhabditis elegans]|eukprot:NP_499063.1 Uncharacterized protein CELE_C38C10.3 [Caenorhabditis elegans]